MEHPCVDCGQDIPECYERCLDCAIAAVYARGQAAARKGGRRAKTKA